MRKIYTFIIFLYLIKELYRNLKTKHHLDRKFSTSIIYFYMGRRICSEKYIWIIFFYIFDIIVFLISIFLCILQFLSEKDCGWAYPRVTLWRDQHGPERQSGLLWREKIISMWLDPYLNSRDRGVLWKNVFTCPAQVCPDLVIKTTNIISDETWDIRSY